MRQRFLLALPRIQSKNASIPAVIRSRSLMRALLFLLSGIWTVSALANEAILEQIRAIEQAITDEDTLIPQVDLAGRTEKYEVAKFSMAYCDRVSAFKGGKLTLSCNQDRTQVSMMFVRLNTPASAIRTAYKRGTLLAKTEKKDFRGWSRRTDPRNFAIMQPSGLNEMLSLGKGLSAKNSVTMALYADHVSASIPQQARESTVSQRPGPKPIQPSTEQPTLTGDLICADLPYDDKTDRDVYGRPNVLEAEIGSDRTRLQLRCDPEFREIQAVRIVMDNALAEEVSSTVHDRGTAVVKFAGIDDDADQSIVTEWIYQRNHENEVVFSPKRKVDERDIYAFFADRKSETSLIKFAFVDDAVSMGQALESASALPIVLLDKTERRDRNRDHSDDGW